MAERKPPNAVPAAPWLTAGLLAATIGCHEDSPRALEVAATATSQQAAQNAEMARLNREVAAGHQRQIDAESQARQRLLEMSRDVQNQCSALEAERREIADVRGDLAADERRESILGPTLYGIAALAASVLPLLVCWRLLAGLERERGDDGELAELLILDLTADGPRLLPSSGRLSLPDEQDRRLPPQMDCDDEPPF